MLNEESNTNFNISNNNENKSPICLCNNNKSSKLNEGKKYLINIINRGTKEFIKSNYE